MLPESPEALAGPWAFSRIVSSRSSAIAVLLQWRVRELHPASKAYETSLSTGPPAARARPTKKAPRCAAPQCLFVGLVSPAGISRRRRPILVVATGLQRGWRRGNRAWRAGEKLLHIVDMWVGR